MANFTNNTWGLAFNETFDVFGSTANGEHSVYVAIPRPYYQGVAGPDRRRQEEDRRPLRDAGEHAEGPAGGRAGRVHRRGGAQLLHRARVPRGILEPHRLRERADRPRRPPGDRRAPGLRLRREGRLEPRRQRRRVVCAGARRSRTRRRVVAPRLLRLHHPAQPDADRPDRAGTSVSERRRQRVRHAAARTRSRPHLPARLEGRASRTRRCR